MAYDDSSDGFGSPATYENGVSHEGYVPPRGHGLPEGFGDHGHLDGLAAHGDSGAYGTPETHETTHGFHVRPGLPGGSGHPEGYGGLGPGHGAGGALGHGTVPDSGTAADFGGASGFGEVHGSGGSYAYAGTCASGAPDSRGAGAPEGGITAPAGSADFPVSTGSAGLGGPVAPEGFPVALKVLVAGGFGVGKTTFVGAVSEIAPLSTEELLTQAGAATDNLDGVESKTSTTVAMDFGRITLDEQHVLYLFGTPGQERFWFMWDELSQGALGAVVLADTRRLTECFAAVDFFERRGIGFVVAVNEFDGAHRYPPEEVRAALDLGPEVPVVLCDARIASSSTRTLVTLVQHLIDVSSAPAPPTAFGARA